MAVDDCLLHRILRRLTDVVLDLRWRHRSVPARVASAGSAGDRSSVGGAAVVGRVAVEVMDPVHLRQEVRVGEAFQKEVVYHDWAICVDEFGPLNLMLRRVRFGVR